MFVHNFMRGVSLLGSYVRTMLQFLGKQTYFVVVTWLLLMTYTTGS